MRADMGKVLVERPRPGSRDGSRPQKGYRKGVSQALADADASRSREGMRARCGGTRSFNENLAPLRRFLHSSVGRPWNKVHAEICQRVDRGNVVQKHILTHIALYVAENVVIIDGIPCDGSGRPLGGRRGSTPLYVCPKTGQLRRARSAPRPRPDPPRFVRFNKREMCMEQNRQLELVTVEPIPGQPHLRTCYDVVRKQPVWIHCSTDRASAKEFYGDEVYAVARRPISRRERLSLPIPIEWLR